MRDAELRCPSDGHACPPLLVTPEPSHVSHASTPEHSRDRETASNSISPALSHAPRINGKAWYSSPARRRDTVLELAQGIY